MNPTGTAAYRTRAALLLILSPLAGLYADIEYRATSGLAAGFVGFAVGFVAALMIGSAIGAVAERRDRRRVGL